MEIRQLRTFHAVATLMSFHKAAKALGYAQSTVSAQIQNLEADLGVQLFERVGRRIHLTSEGDTLLEYAQQMIELEAEARTNILATTPALPAIRLHASAYLCTTYLATILNERHLDEHALHVRCAAHTPHELHDAVNAGNVDLALFFGNKAPGEGVEATSLGTEPFVLTGPRQGQLSGQLLLTDQALSEQVLLVFSPETEANDLVDARLRARKVSFARTVQLDCLATLLELVSAGRGVAFLPQPLARKEQQAGRLAILAWEGGRPEVPLHMLHQQGISLPEPLKNFVDGIREAKKAV